MAKISDRYMKQQKIHVNDIIMADEATGINLSIVIPVYNEELNLRECVATIENQGMPDDSYEVILVDDGSQDGSPKICDEIAAKNSNYISVHPQHAGKAEAINYGLALATGKWVMVVYACDRLISNGLHYALHVASQHQYIDIIRYDCNKDFLGTGRHYVNHFGLPRTSRGFIFRVEFLNKHHVFMHDYIYFEDPLFVSHAIMANSQIICVNRDSYWVGEDLYDYRKNKKVEVARKLVRDGLKANSHMFSYMLRYNIKNNPVAYNLCIDHINRDKVMVVNQMLVANYSHSEFKRLRHQCKKQDFYPVFRWERTQRCRRKINNMNRIINSWFIYKLARLFNYSIEEY